MNQLGTIMVSEYRMAKWERGGMIQIRRGGGSEGQAEVETLLPPSSYIWVWTLMKAVIWSMALMQLWGFMVMSTAPVTTKGHYL